MLDGETVHYEMKLSLRMHATPDDARRTTVQELSHSGDAPLGHPVIADLGEEVRFAACWRGCFSVEARKRRDQEPSGRACM
jgi:hypothetical protein